MSAGDGAARACAIHHTLSHTHTFPPLRCRLRNKGALTRTGGFVQAVALSEEEEDLVGSSALLARLVRLGVVGGQQQQGVRRVRAGNVRFCNVTAN